MKRSAAVNEQEGVIAPRQDRRNIVAELFVLGMVHDTNRAMTPLFVSLLGPADRIANYESVFGSSTMYDIFPTALTGRRHSHDVHRSTPFIGRDDVSLVRSESDQHDLLGSIAFAGKLAEIDFAVIDHVRMAGISNV